MEYKKLGHIAKIQTGPFGSQLHQSDYKPTGIPCIMPCNIGSNLNIICDNIAYISEEDLNRLDKHKTQEGDIVYSRRGDIEKCAYISSRESGWLCGTGCLKVSIDSTIALPKYVAYLLSTPESKAWLVGNAVGTTMLNLNTTVLSDFPICLPDLDTQQKVVEIIDSIADKIELNKRINDNLEQQLQALYNEWFVENPKSDWHSVNLSEIATFVSGYSYKGNELVENSDTAMATIKNFERNGGFKIDGYKPIIPSPKLKVDQRAQLFDILVAHTDLTQNAEVIGNAEILLSKDIYKNLIFSMDLVKVIAKESFPFQFLLALLLKNPRFKSHCIGYVNGTTVLHMNKKALPDYETIIPNLEDAQNLNATAKAIFCQMSENLTEISNLTEMRDTLLPRLISGELKINDLDS